MIRINYRKSCVPLSFFAAGLCSFVGAAPVFAQNTGGVTSSISPLESPAGLAVIGGILLVLLAVSLLLVFLIDTKHFPRKELFSVVWPLTKRHLWLLIGVFVFQQLLVQLPTVLTAVVQNAMNLSKDDPLSNFLESLVAFILGVIMQSGLVALALHLIDGMKVSFSDLFSQLSVFWRYVGASILYGLMVAGGLLLLVVPGIYWMLTYSLWPYFLVDKKVSVMDSLKMSAQATRGYRWSLLLLYLFILALNIVGFFVFIVGIFVTAPMSALILAHAYRKMTGSAASLSA